MNPISQLAQLLNEVADATVTITFTVPAAKIVTTPPPTAPESPASLTNSPFGK